MNRYSDCKDYSVSVFTVCNLAYLAKTLVLAESLFKYSKITLKIFVFDKQRDIDVSDKPVEIYWIEDLNVPDFDQLAFKYDVIEFTTCLKPFITTLLLKEKENVIFMDPDTCFFHSIEPILADLDKGSILLTPHYTTPQSNDLAESDTGMMRFGSFNLGFYAVKRSEQSLYFLNWWSQRCIDLCYMDSQFGLSTDQKWIAIAPCFFKDINISFNLGYNVAAWNSWERKLSKDMVGEYYVNETGPLIFFHFSNFYPDDLEYLNKRSCYEKGVRRPDLYEVGDFYNQRLIANNIAIDCTYSYDFMTDGKYISPTLRRAYACILPELPANHQPFDANGVVAKFAKRNNLYEKEDKAYKRESFGAVSKNSGILKLLYLGMRLMLWVVGPNKFMNLSRLMVYLSSYRQNRGLWKY